IKEHQGIIANPNCSTIQMVAALKPIQAAYGLNRVIVSTYQAVSGAGNAACDELQEQSQQYLKEEEMKAELLPVGGDKKHYHIDVEDRQQIDVFRENDCNSEEMKMSNEKRKIMHATELSVAATCVRMPFFTSHAESVYVEVEQEGLTVADFWIVLDGAEGVI